MTARTYKLYMPISAAHGAGCSRLRSQRLQRFTNALDGV